MVRAMARATRVQVLRRAAALGVAGCLLSSCGSHPGEAAVVGSQPISQSRLDDVAAALCSAQAVSQQTTGQQDLSSRAARQGALDVLIQSEISKQYVEKHGFAPSAAQTSQAVSSQQQTLDSLPASRRGAFRSVLQDYAEGQLGLAAAGAKQLQASGTAKPTQDQALSTGLKLRDAWAGKHVKVSVDPRFGRFRGGALVTDSGSLSVPESSTAVAGAADKPPTGWLSSLPANQKCS